MIERDKDRRDSVKPPGERLLRAEIETYLKNLADRIASVVGSKGVGTYLHGSAVLGGFNASRSDLDILVIVSGKLLAREKAALGEQLSNQALPVPAETLELSVVTLDTVRSPTAAPEYELHINTRDGKAADGSGKTDPDLTLHFAIAWQSGRLIGAGMPPAQVFAPVPRELVLAGMIKELCDAVEGELAAPEYLVLNACRNLAYASQGTFYSKVAGGRWALTHLPDLVGLDGGLISDAIDRQIGSGTGELPIDRPAAARMALDVADRLQRQDLVRG
jgi:streptomycin 3"-adenylyltransferase